MEHIPSARTLGQRLSSLSSSVRTVKERQYWCVATGNCVRALCISKCCFALHETTGTICRARFMLRKANCRQVEGGLGPGNGMPEAGTVQMVGPGDLVGAIAAVLDVVHGRMAPAHDAPALKAGVVLRLKHGRRKAARWSSCRGHPPPEVCQHHTLKHCQAGSCQTSGAVSDPSYPRSSSCPHILTPLITERLWYTAPFTGLRKRIQVPAVGWWSCRDDMRQMFLRAGLRRVHTVLLLTSCWCRSQGESHPPGVVGGQVAVGKMSGELVQLTVGQRRVGRLPAVHRSCSSRQGGSLKGGHHYVHLPLRHPQHLTIPLTTRT